MQSVVFHLVQRDSSAIKFDKVEMAFFFSVTLLAETINRWRNHNVFGLWEIHPIVSHISFLHVEQVTVYLNVISKSSSCEEAT